MGITPGPEIQSAMVAAVVAFTQGGTSWKNRLVMSSGGTQDAMSWISEGMSSRNCSMAQSAVWQVLSDLLQASPRMCWPSFAEEW